MLGAVRAAECGAAAGRAERIVVTAGPAIATPPGVPVADACTITPALRTWIECLVDARVDQSSRAFREGELAGFLGGARREAQGAVAPALAAAQQGERARQRLELQVRGLVDAQARLLAVVEGFSGDAERQQSSSTRARAEALVTVERVVSTVDELQRTVEQDGDAASARLRQHDAALEELRRQQAEEALKHRAALAELQRLQSEGAARQRQCSEELAQACGAVAATRREVGDLGQLVQRLELRLQAWRAEVAAELSEELGARLAAREAAAEADRLKLEAAQREAQQAAAARIELEARVEGLRVELAGLAPVRGDAEPRLREGQHALARRLDALQAAAAKDAEGARTELEELAQAVERLDRRLGAWRAEVSKEIRAAAGAREAAELAREQGPAGLEAFRREASQQWSEAEHRFERLHVELTAAAAMRESFEFRIREGQEELRRLVDAWQGSLPRELGALQQRVARDVEGWQGEVREELAQLQRRLSAELRAETRALLKGEQNAIAALDEQLWLTDQRLGQRIDELVQAAGRGERLAAAAATAATTELAARSPAPRAPGLGGAPGERAEEEAPRGDVCRNLMARLSDAEQLERLRGARKRGSLAAGAGAGAAEAAAEGGPGPGAAARRSLGGRATLSMAREAAEAFEDAARLGD